MQQNSVIKKDYRKIILGIVTVLHWFSMYTYVPYFTPYMKSLGAAATLVGMGAGAYGMTQMILRIPIGITADKMGRQKIFVILGVALSAISSLGMRLFPNPVMLLICRGLCGASAATWVCFPILYSSYFSEGESTKAIGNINAMNNFGRLAATFLGGVVAQALGIPSSFTLSFVAGILAVILSFFVADVKLDREPLALRELVTVIKNKRLMFGCLLACCFQFISFATAFAFTSNVASDLGATEMELSIVTTLFTLTNFMGSLLVGRIFVKKLGEKKVLIIAFALLVLYCILVPVVPTVGVICILQLFGGLGNGSLSTLLMSVAVRSVEPAKKSTAMGAYQAIYGIGMTFGPIVMGSMVESFGYVPGFSLMAGVAAVSIVLVLCGYKNNK